ncbi:aldehyde dehydrogenase family protein [Alphaproteobacteria bacterium GH1-50]|uniref:Aldehyde dehydrogenase family protein n=1 Tax=Kangsaoukella pontilimi TaxID=2691042 RepID=A0A7C9IKF4_9RHOB|nr:aldehyde dehydrogenase [Kangsaoukella pontilimi]MXQ09562.1 aldehyde dehydrogenase family protein [Kangsaoukella pontilimi]
MPDTATQINQLSIPDYFPLHIGGEPRDATGGARFVVENPATGEAICEMAEGDASDVDAAVKAAHAASKPWGANSGAERADILNRIAALLTERLDDFIAVEVAQTGRPIREMRAQLARLPEWYTYFAAVARTHESNVHPFGGPYLNYSRRMPLGVVGLVTPWNHPLLILTKKLAPALAAGNAVVVKPSEVAPITPMMLAALMEEAGLPPGVCNMVTGMGPIAGAALSTHEGIAKLDLTGGTETGRRVAALAGERLTQFAGELGGKAPVIVFDDVLDSSAAAATLFASFIAAGQTCVQGARLLVQNTVREKVVDMLVERTQSLVVGDPTQFETQIGPMVSKRQLDVTMKYVEIGKNEGATLAAGGERLTGGIYDTGYYHAPTVFTDVTNDMRIAQEEIFGPVVCVLGFDTEEEAIALANGTEFGLAASIWTKDITRAHRVSQSIEAGIVWINDHHRIDPSSPWGGFKASGIGKENGIVCYEGYTKLQSVVVNLSDDRFDWFEDSSDKRYS